MKKRLVTLALISALVALPYQHLPAEDPPPPDDLWLAVAFVACVGVAAGMVYVVNKKAQPKYYWLMDDDTPPKFWVGTATRKQCAIEGWKRIGGPYDRPQDAPAQHPNPTNVVSLVAGPPVNQRVESSTNGRDWTTVYQETCDPEDFGYFPTNAVGAMFRLVEVRP